MSAGIETVIEREDREESSVGDTALCTACEMAVVWAQNQLKQKGTKERVLQYIDQVRISELFWNHFMFCKQKLQVGAGIELNSCVRACQVQWESR